MSKRTTIYMALAAAAMQAGCAESGGHAGGKYQHIQVNGASISYVEKGTGEPIVAVHGAMSDLRVWEALGEKLSDKHRFIAYTQRYFGTGPWADDGENFSRNTHVDDLITFIEALDLGPVHVVTWSYGGDVATYAAAQRPDLFRTVSHYEPSVDFVLENSKQGEESQAAFREALKPAITVLRKGDAERAAFRFVEIIAGLPEGAAETEASPMPGMFRENARTMAPMMAMRSTQTLTYTALAELRTPTLIVIGSRTHERYKLIAMRLERCLPNAKLHVISGAHHDGPYRHAEQLADLIEAFLRRE